MEKVFVICGVVSHLGGAGRSDGVAFRIIDLVATGVGDGGRRWRMTTAIVYVWDVLERMQGERVRIFGVFGMI